MVYDEFRKLLREAMGTMTQSAFSNLSGISVEHLNRMLNKDDMHRPSKTTLRKIIAVSPGVNPKDLYQSCGYPADDVHVEVSRMRTNLDILDRMALTAGDIQAGFEKLIHDARQFNSLSDMMQYYIEKYGVDARRISYGTKEVLAPYGMNGDFVVRCVAKWRMRKDVRYYYNVDTYFGVIYVKTSKGMLMATDVVTDGAGLFSLGCVPQEYVDMLYEDGTNVTDLPYVSIATQEYDNDSPEHRLLTAIFGDPNAESRELSLFHTDWGRGSVYEKTPDGFVEYMFSNEGFFKASEEEQEKLDELKDVKTWTPESLDVLFRDYVFENAKGTAAAVLAVMRRKFDGLGHWFTIEYGVSEDFEEVFKPVLYVSEDWYTEGEKLVKDKMDEIDVVLKKEFRALKMPTYGSTLVYAAYRVSPESYLEGQEPLT